MKLFLSYPDNYLVIQTQHSLLYTVTDFNLGIYFSSSPKLSIR